jgi:hypothetical protein
MGQQFGCASSGVVVEALDLKVGDEIEISIAGSLRMLRRLTSGAKVATL